ncbi:MAG TPA: TonB-dependent receptor [Thermoanaerobaculia bacterium]|nr:TonB-dependent receptor [Thermoanaerobaculia bacterium]
MGQSAEKPPVADPATRQSTSPTEPEAEPPPETPAPAAGTATSASLRLFDALLVVGDSDAARRLPGSAHVINQEQLDRQGYGDLHRILAQVPGVIVQEEDGFGLRPNIGLRGTGVERSQKITLLEDGVLIAPAPYSAPAAYYSPTAGRLSGVEVRKGSSSIRQGPFTNGGALNLLSTGIPERLRARVSIEAGEDQARRARGWVGGASERVGWLFETYQAEHGGFKDLDGGGDTGFELEDYLGKVRFTSRPDARRHQALELKLGATDQHGDETYLGLTRRDFDLTPYRRYAASQGDVIDADHEQIQLNHLYAPSARFELTTAVYRNDFARNWYKLDRVAGAAIADVLERPEAFAAELSVLRGEQDSAPGALLARNNRREYYGRGVQTIARLDLGAAGSGVRHDLELGLRWHEDEEDRFQEDDRYQMLGGRRVLTALGQPGSQDNRVAEAQAFSVFAQDVLTIGRFTLTPGVRVESIDLRRNDFGRSDPGRAGGGLVVRDNSLTEVIPGLGVDYQVGQGSVFLGVHRGFAPPAPGSVEEVEAESSVNYEAGYRWAKGAARAEVIGFFNDYDNLLGTDTLSSGGGGTGDQFNGGEVEVRGLEAALAFERRLGARYSLPVRLAYTFSEGEFGTSFLTAFEDWAPEVRRGDDLPYLPQHHLHAALSLRASRWAAHVDATWVDEMRTSAGSGAPLETERIPSHGKLDFRLERDVSERFTLSVQALNVTDEVYVAARRPAGLRPGLPRSLVVGLRFDF